MNINELPTEQRNPDTMNIDEVSTLEMLKLINNEDKKVALAVEKHLDDIAKAVDAVAEKFAAGGRIVYIGAGTSGRMGFMDSAECPPTFGVPSERVVSVIAGGQSAMGMAIEGAEDNREAGVADLKAINFGPEDALVGIAASGRTPYVLGGMEYANQLGSVTVGISCNEDMQSPLNSIAQYPIGIYAGPEAITGSTRMKAGTVQKMVLNMLSTGVMIKTGKVYSNLMVNVQPSNEKLIIRAQNIVMEVTGESLQTVEPVLKANKYDVSLTIFMLLTGCPQEKAKEILKNEGGHIKKSLAAFNAE